MNDMGLHVVVIEYDNTEPTVYGPFKTGVAARAFADRDALYTHHMTDINVRPLKAAPK